MIARAFSSVRRIKVILARDYQKLGFFGETVWVKPGYAQDYLIPRKIAKYAIPKNIQTIESKVDYEALERKQSQRVLDLYLERLKKIQCIYERAVSPLNQQVIELPVLKVRRSQPEEEILETLERNHGVKIKSEEMQMEYTIDTVGEHLLRTQFFSEHFDRSILFNVRVLVRPRR